MSKPRSFSGICVCLQFYIPYIRSNAVMRYFMAWEGKDTFLAEYFQRA